MYCPNSQFFGTPNLVRHQGKQRVDHQYTTVWRSDENFPGPICAPTTTSRPSRNSAITAACQGLMCHPLPSSKSLVSFCERLPQAWHSPSFDAYQVVVNCEVPSRASGRSIAGWRHLKQGSALPKAVRSGVYIKCEKPSRGDTQHEKPRTLVQRRARTRMAQGNCMSSAVEELGFRRYTRGFFLFIHSSHAT